MQLNLDWRWYAWDEIDATTLYALLKLRVDVFVVEQKCAYPELDGLDTACDHLLVRDADGALIAYLRLLPPDLKSSRPIIGRMLLAEYWPGRGIARELAQAGDRKSVVQAKSVSFRVHLGSRRLRTNTNYHRKTPTIKH